MGRLRLYTVFHGNLDFSALPDRDLPLVIERCYWPLLALAEGESIPIGIEMSARTVRRIADEDPEWMKTLGTLSERGLVELVGSGWAQVVAPLAPADVNRANFGFGKESYERDVGCLPETWFVNEQTFARGLADLYGEIGVRRLVMEWNNPASHQPALRSLRYKPARIESSHGDIDLLWNDCVIFQKLQRAVHGEISMREYWDAVARAHAPDEDRALCVYGGDLEIFDYRPGQRMPEGAEQGLEMARLAQCLRGLAEDERFVFRLPRDVIEPAWQRPLVQLTVARDPIPCKKQPRYNPTRWAVSGRDGFGINTQCFALRRELRIAEALRGTFQRERSREQWKSLVDLWGSDFRTRSTEEKAQRFSAEMGAARVHFEDRFEALVPPLGGGCDLELHNPFDAAWEGWSVEVPLRFPPGRFPALRVESSDSDAAAWQVDVDERYRDGCIRRARLVGEPRLAPNAPLRLWFRAEGAPSTDFAELDPSQPVTTRSVEAHFALHRGAALAWARFPKIDPAPLVGTLPHGSFDTIDFTPDLYSAHTVAFGHDARKITDLTPARLVKVVRGPVRDSLTFETPTPHGDWTKTYRLYHRQPRLDLIHGLRFLDARLASLRMGHVTLLPDAFERDSLGFSTINGGREPEVFRLEPGTRLEQGRAVSPSVSATSCLGATEGWVSLGDERRGVGIWQERALAAVAPLVDFCDVDDSFFLRVSHSAAETDETQAVFFRGTRRIAVSLVGHRNDLGSIDRLARAGNRGLAYRTEAGVGITRGI